MAISSLHIYTILSFLITSILLHPTLSEIRFTEIRSDTRPIISLDEFGYTHTGILDLNVTLLSLHLQNNQTTNQTTTTPPNDLSQLGFFLCTRNSWPYVLDQLSSKDIVCPLESDLIKPVFTFNRLNNGGKTHFNLTIHISNPDIFTFVFANCIPNLQISMDVLSSMYNLEHHKGIITRNYLSIGMSNLPWIYFTFALVYVGLCLLWGYILYYKRNVSYKVHYFMHVVLLLKALNLLSEAENKEFIKLSGTPHGWDILFYIFSFLKGITLFILIVLIGTGWSFLRPYLYDQEKRVLMVVIPVQVVANVAQVVIDETGPYGEDLYAWNEIFFLVDVVCCCAVLFSLVWSIKNLREAARSDGKAAVNLMKLTLFRRYYVVVICYIYLTRAIVFGLETITSYRYEWTSVVAGELGTLAFYLFTGYNFRPKSFNPYFVIDDEEEEATVEMFRREENEFKL